MNGVVIGLEEEKEARWIFCIKQARSLYLNRNAARFQITELAIAACDIVHGGGAHWNKFENQRTVKKFSEAVGLSSRTLHEWIQIKQKVYDKLSAKDQKNYHYTAMADTRKITGSLDWPEEAVRTAYQRLVRIHTNADGKASKPLFQAHRYIRNLEHAVGKVGRAQLNSTDKSDLLDLKEKCEDCLREIKKLI